MNILEEFWYGNIEPAEYDTSSGKEYKELLQLISRNEDKLVDLALSQVEADLTEYTLKYARLDQYGRDAVEAIIRAEHNRCRCKNTLCPATAYSGYISIKREEVKE